jgi:hypothetical protein
MRAKPGGKQIRCNKKKTKKQFEDIRTFPISTSSQFIELLKKMHLMMFENDADE